MKHYIFMAVTTDKLELPLMVGSAVEVARWAGTTENNVRSHIYHGMNGEIKGYKFVRVEEE